MHCRRHFFCRKMHTGTERKHVSVLLHSFICCLLQIVHHEQPNMSANDNWLRAGVFFCVFLNKAADGAKMFVLMFANNYRLIFSLFSDQWVKSCVSISPLSKDMTHHRQSQRQKLRVDSMYSPTSVSTQTPWVLKVWLFIYIQMLNCCCRRCWCDYKLNQHDSQ